MSASTAYASSVVINEIMAKPDDETEWVELYNSSDNTIDLSGWKIKDGNNSITDDINLSGQINSNGFIVFEHNKGWLNDSGDEIVTLLDSSDSIIDNNTYNGPQQGKTFARIPDGGTWNSNVSPTKGISNGNVSPSPTPTSSPSPTPTPTSSPSPSPTPVSSPQSAFIISNTPSVINSDQAFSVNVVLSSNSPSSKYYLKGAFIKNGFNNYFGYTKVSGNWVKNAEPYASQFSITTDSLGNYSGSIETKPDPNDNGFSGTGDYTFKIGKYLDGNSSISWSNETNIKINSTLTPTPTPSLTPSPTPSPTTRPTTSPSSTRTPLPTSDNGSTPTPSDDSLSENETFSFLSNNESSVAGVETESSAKLSSPLKFILSLSLIIIGICFLGLGIVYLKNNRGHIFWK
jgi:hypothetical protein